MVRILQLTTQDRLIGVLATGIRLETFMEQAIYRKRVVYCNRWIRRSGRGRIKSMHRIGSQRHIE